MLSLSPFRRRRISFTAKILWGTRHVIYVRLPALHHLVRRTGTPFLSPYSTASTRCSITNNTLSCCHFLSTLKSAVTMTTTLKEQARQSGLVLSDDTAEWNENDWPPLEGGWRSFHTSIVLNHPAKTNYNNDKAQTVVVMGGCDKGWNTTNSVLALNLAKPNKQWREGPPMKKKRSGHAAVVCNGGVYVMGGNNGVNLDCMERIDSNDLLQSSSTSSSTCASHWTRLNCRLSTGRSRCGAVAIQNRYIVVIGGWNMGYLSSVEIIDTNNHIVNAGPSLTVPRQYCASSVIGYRIFVVGGRNDHGHLDSVEYIDFATPCDNDKTKMETGSTLISFSSTWIIHSDLVLSNARSSFAMVAVESCLVVAGGWSNSTVEVLDTHRNRVWNLPPLGYDCVGCNMVTVANQVAVIGGYRNLTCATMPLMDKNSWCFHRLCEQQSNGWYHSLEGMAIRDADISPFTTSTSARKQARPNTCQNDRGNDET